MKLKWNLSAKSDMRQVARYVNRKFGRKARQEFMQRVKDVEKMIMRQPNIGSFARTSGLTYYSARKQLNQWTEGQNPKLLKTRRGQEYIYTEI